MGDSDRLGTFSYIARELGERGLAFICAREHKAEDWIGPRLKQAFGGTYIANEKFTYESATETLAAGEADAVAFGQLFIANPDLVERFRIGAPLNEPHPDSFYAGGAHGYVDYPALQSKAA